ncbi:MAG: hypothetical protein B9S37_01820 [Verrucomicrobiia bacterium Tous-C3TDCM]|nr:MAG: hypothetical protein B9S37_01820 [Verrucomicrobiae bacterium Tous-C3TDCM]PAZ06674.1 MAG: hypothetical protein CAK88_04120 [Verrucomicrobiae bacterium AMD-G2]
MLKTFNNSRLDIVSYLRMKKSAIIKSCSAGAIAVALSSCIEVNETVNLKKDGSGTIVEETILGSQMSAMMQQMAALGGGESPDMFGEDAAKKRAEKFGKGVTVAKVEKINADGKTGSRVTFNFSDINTVSIDMSDSASGLSDMAPPGAAEEAKKEAGETKPITFSFKDGELTIINPQAKKPDAPAVEKDAEHEDTEEAAPDAGPEAAQMQAMAMGMMKDMKMTAKIVVESGIAETNATYHEGNTVTLMEMDFGKLMADPKVVEQMKGLDIQDPAALQEKIKNIPGIKGEEKEKVTIKVK